MGYPSDVTDNDWVLLSHMLEKKSTGCYEQKYSKRDLLNGILYVNKTGCQWQYLPKDYPPWSSVYHYFRHLSRKGIFFKINSVLTIMVRLKSGRTAAPSLVSIDSQSVKGDVNIDEKGIDGHKMVNGRKRHILADVLGIVICCLVTSANIPDVTAGNKLIKRAALSTVKKVLGDQAYKKLQLPEDTELEIASRPPSVKGFVPVKLRWIVERTFAWLSRQRRLSKDYEVRVEHQESMIYIGMMKIMLNKYEEASPA